MYTFYSTPGACSKSFQILLETLGAPYQTNYVSIKKGETRTPEYLKMNPKGQVPLLVDGPLALAEGMAIAIYLTEKHPGKSPLIPNEEPARAKAWQGVAYMNTFVHGLHSTYFGAERNFSDVATQTAVKQSVHKRLIQYYGEMEQFYGQNKFYAGDAPSLADVMFTVMAGWAPGAGLADFKFGPNCARVIAAVQAHPAWIAVTKQEEQATATEKSHAA